MKILKILTESDLYTGIIVASEQNERHLYKLILLDDCIRYKSVGFINDAGVLEKYEEGVWFSTVLYNDIWCETEDSRKMNTACIREDRLKELGI